VVADSVLRLKPGVLAEQKGYEEESYWDGLLEYPQYTRPEVWEGRAVPQVLLGGDHQKIDAWRSEQSRKRTRLRRPELYEQWCRSHPVEELPKWKRGENMRLVKTDEQFAAAAHIFVEGRRATCAENWTPEYCASLNEEEYLLQLRQEKAAGWACYLHTTKEVPDGIVSINHKVGHIEHLFVTEEARGRGIGMKMLDFARKKLSEHEHPVLSVLNTNTRAIALYTRMGWEMTSGTELEFTPEQYPAVVKKCALVWMRYEGGAQK
jgi:tRNA (guanine37-N1)-methyltransferase